MPEVLIVEDSRLFANLLQKRVTEDFHVDCLVRSSYQEAVDTLEQDTDKFMLAILDITLPGSPDGEIVDYVTSKGIPVIIVTARMDDQTREKILSKRVLDYIVKGPHTLDLVSSTIHRYLRNQRISILLVDDSALSRETARRILETQHFRFLEATHGAQALELISRDPSIKLVLTDFNMPTMDGYELTTEIRKCYAMDKLAILGMSAYGNPLLSSQFLKRGANDFITKPYFEEELIWRVNQNIEMLEHIEQLREWTIKDPLTGLYNRRYFFQTGEKLLENARRQNLEICVAMIDIDHFKVINDNFGHMNGDLVIKKMGEVLQKSFRSSDIVARFGGEEFIIMTANMHRAHLFDHFEQLRLNIAKQEFSGRDFKQRVTVSIGVASQLQDTLDEMIKQADGLLYKAKNAGRNRTEVDF